MRLDDVAPRTLLLAGLAGWAACAWVLALAGMGGRLPAPPSGAIAGSTVPGLPAQEPPPALGPYARYGEIAARPLFAIDRRPHPFSIGQEAGKADAPPDFDLVLTSVLITPQARIAIVQKPDGSGYWRVRPGEAPESQPGWTLVDLLPRSAVFEGPGGRKELTLRVFDGKGGVAPPPMAGVPVDPPATMGTSRPAPPPTDASAVPDPAQIDMIRRRIEARREEMRRQAQSTNPPAKVAPTSPETR